MSDDEGAQERTREFWERFRDRMETAGGVLSFPDFDVDGIAPVRWLQGIKPEDQ